MKKYISNSVGRRKTSVARLYLKPGTGKIIINNKTFLKNYSTYGLKNKIFHPLELTNNKGKFDIYINIYGGGVTSQAEAIILALARSLCKIHKDYRKIFKLKKLLTRDSRMVERKKYGRKKSRKKFQFSKR
ncbi:30S ribosomal protein S9 [Candidatus Karelsulcia muelleri]